mmetsp:Transcript_23838/g.23511  ORF Transcript_23838/g.23511 Transcript_23838/m.23511 type:complete len:88 (+) Transcript_23838:34-297(+)
MSVSLACTSNGFGCTSDNSCCSGKCNKNFYCGNTDLSWWAWMLIWFAVLCCIGVCIAIIRAKRRKQMMEQMAYHQPNTVVVTTAPYY